ncbi:MBL fold metallo-hydrolase [Vibrio alginolyticus]|uniref:MBL fold metallo-hydrolase n=1 Tax=Vibrio TaxID=662 RepID=UPI001BD4C13F|nr:MULTISPECIES: MBL fold metallo-hydrolase [Vibrio]ELA7187662.1 MBL fold metallo-hydrolase [Vibrio alginolyticus]ELB2787259.1 MBL fold metallo-hydrolase [Vibrio alginolyticus]MBS9923336.1 MBL fold metallo-hydrolase [Vibrio alginolyticus]MDK9729460.1 MBL fold metallo-hydrolase [Vibrio sp. D415a]MDK9745671.1 MBL fold metallo-hydrolase [Vibrio sp. D409a]
MGTSMISCSNVDTEKAPTYPDKFANTELEYKSGLGDMFEIMKAYFTTERLNPTPTIEIPVHAITAQQLLEEQDDVIYRLGHSSVLMKLDGKLVMTDPVFSDRASPVQWAGPKRFHQTPITIEDLPTIDVVVISHDHYDHLDKASIKVLGDKVGTFLVPLKVGQLLVNWGVPKEKVIELDWWESHSVDGIEYTLTPTQHFSGRGLTDRDTTLWGSWVINAQQHKVFFSGDSGYFNGFKEIGEKYGPFDFTMIETGAYNELWSDIHMFPEQSVQAHIDVQGKVMMPIHNSTFDLSMHDWNEPMQRALDISEERGVTLVSPEIGQRLAIAEPQPAQAWWQ